MPLNCGLNWEVNLLFTGIIQEKGQFLRKFKGSSKYQLEIWGRLDNLNFE